MVCVILSQAGTTWNGALSCAREIQSNKSEVSKNLWLAAKDIISTLVDRTPSGFWLVELVLLYAFHVVLDTTFLVGLENGVEMVENSDHEAID